MSHLLIFGLGYTASQLADRLVEKGWRVTGTRRTGSRDRESSDRVPASAEKQSAAARVIRFDDAEAVRTAIASATHILASVPPAGETDPVLEAYAADLAEAPAEWIGYLSSTGVYGDTGGAWVDESAPYGGRRAARAEADRAWLALRPDARVFRLPGIYGPARSPLDRVRAGRAHRVDLPGQVFSRVHVDDIVSGVVASFTGPPGAYNLADDRPASQNAVIEEACLLLGVAPPPLETLDEAGLSTEARGFYAENRRVANGKAKRLLGWTPRYQDYRAGLRALNAISSPAIVNPAPAAAPSDQR